MRVISCIFLLAGSLFFAWIGGTLIDMALYVQFGPTWEEVRHVPITPNPKYSRHIP